MSNAIIILAAGAASRMQQPKMLLPFGSGNLLSHIIDGAIAANAETVILVTGCYHKEIIESVNQKGIRIVYNTDWANGMASSINCGLSAVLETAPETESVLIAVSDQPHIHHSLLLQMLNLKNKSGKGIIAARYGNTTGTPVLFDRKYFDSLQQLSGDSGAKSILQQNQEDLATVAFPEGSVDIDTPEDYLQLMKTKRNAYRYP